MRKSTSAFLAVASVGISTLLVAPTATAAPSGCHATESGTAWVGTCDGGTGEFRIRVDCQNWPDHTSPWTRVGQQTAADCGIEHARGHSFEVRD